MTTINFPASPTSGYALAGGDKVWVYNGETWKLAKYQPASSGFVDAGTPSGPVGVILGGGVPRSSFTAGKGVDGGLV